MQQSIGLRARRLIARTAYSALKAVGAASTADLDNVVSASARQYIGAYPDLGKFENQAKAFTESAYVYTAVSKITNAAALVNFQVHSQNDRGNRMLDNHPFTALLRKPNPWQSQFEFIEATFGYHELNGNAYWYVAVDGAGQPVELYLLNPARVRIVPGLTAANYVAGYVYTVHGVEVPLEVNEVMHWKIFNPVDDYYGLSRLQAIALNVGTETAMTAWNRNFFGKERATPAGIIDVHEFVDDTQFERLKEDWRESFGGTERKTAFIRGGGISYTPIGMSHVDMDFLGGLQEAKEIIMLAFGIPPGMLDKNSTEANASAGLEYFTANTMWPLVISFCQRVTAHFAQYYGEETVIESEDFRANNAKDERQEIQAYSSYLTVNEVRDKYMNLPPLPMPDADKPATGLLAVSASGVAVGNFDALPKPGEPGTDPAGAAADGPVPVPDETESVAKAIAASIVRNLPAEIVALPAVRLTPPLIDGRARKELSQFAGFVARGKPIEHFRWLAAPRSTEIAAKAWADVARGEDIDLIATKAIKTPSRIDANGNTDPFAAEKNKGEQAIQQAMADYLSELQADVIRIVRHVSAATKALPDVSTFADYFDADFWKAQTKQLIGALRGPVQDLVEQTAIAQGQRFAMQLGLGFDAAQFAIQANDYMAQYIDMVLTQLGTTDQTGVGAVIQRWIGTPGATLQDAVDALTQSPLFGEARAELIAITETTRAFSAGVYIATAEAADQTNVDVAITQEDATGILPVHPRCRCWSTSEPQYDSNDLLTGFDVLFHTSNDELVCPACSPNDGKLFSDIKTGG